MQNNNKRFLKFLIPTAFWLCIWHIASLIIGHSFLLPSISDTFIALTELLKETKFYLVTLYSIFRVLFGLILGSLIGVILAYASHRFSFINYVISPLFTVIRSTPIASIIIFLYIMMSGNMLTVIIAVMMVAPIVWQNVLDSFNSIPKDLAEVCDAYEVDGFRRFKILVLPTVIKFFIPALITSSSLCWKASVSAEIIAYTTKSIGQFISDAKNDLNSPRVFACTVVVIFLSIILEKLSKKLLRRCEAWL